MQASGYCVLKLSEREARNGMKAKILKSFNYSKVSDPPEENAGNIMEPNYICSYAILS
jgi:hypothetical protein